VAHQHYKGTGQMHSFRGFLVDEGQDKIRIEGATGEIAWRITKFEIMVTEPGEQSSEHVVQIWREEQDTISNTVNFDNDELLGMAWLGFGATTGPTNFLVSIFDNQLFVRNLYIGSKDASGNSKSVNYYIELEEVKVSAAGMAQLAVAATRRT